MITSEGGDVKGPFYYKMLKSGKLRSVESVPKGKHVIEYIENIAFQDKMHYLSLMKEDGYGGHTLTYECDFRSVCGYDRGPKFEGVLSRILNL
jgi:hypothetical protein